MSQAAYQVDDQDGASFLVTINEILSAIRTGNSGATEPNETYPFMTWVDTGSGAVKQRNSADDAWVTLYILTSGQLAQLNGMTLTGAINYKRATVAADATATALWTAAKGNIQDWTGTPTITDFPEAPQAGAKREVYPAAGTVITNAGSISVQGNGDRTSEAGEKWIVTAVTTTTFYVEVIKKDGTAVSSSAKLYNLDAVAVGNDLVITVNPGVWDFRSPTLTDGTPNTRTLSVAETLTIPNGATLGSVNAIESTYVVGLQDNAGTLKAFAINLAGGNQLDETNLLSTTTISTGADSNNVAYAVTGVASLPYRIIGFIKLTQATAGVYATQPTLVQGGGGQTLKNLTNNGMFLLKTNIANNSAVIDFTDIQNNVYDSYLIVCDQVLPATNGANLLLRTSNSGVFAAASYTWQSWRWTTAATGVVGQGGTASGIALSASSADAMANTAGQGSFWEIKVSNCAQSSHPHRVIYEGGYLGSAQLGIRGNGIPPNTTPIDGFRFLMDIGNIASGTFKLYGLKG